MNTCYANVLANVSSSAEIQTRLIITCHLNTCALHTLLTKYECIVYAMFNESQ